MMVAVGCRRCCLERRIGVRFVLFCFACLLQLQYAIQKKKMEKENAINFTWFVLVLLLFSWILPRIWRGYVLRPRCTLVQCLRSEIQTVK